jgi:hypothetical protein
MIFEVAALVLAMVA